MPKETVEQLHLRATRALARGNYHAALVDARSQFIVAGGSDHTQMNLKQLLNAHETLAFAHEMLARSTPTAELRNLHEAAGKAHRDAADARKADKGPSASGPLSESFTLAAQATQKVIENDPWFQRNR